MQIISESKITGMGSGALDFVEDKILILFSDQVGNGIEEYSVQITMPQPIRDIVPGDNLRFGTSEYKVTAIGSKAMETFRLLGHCTIHFDGRPVPVLPGVIHVEEKVLPEVVVGESVCFYC